jgi:dihydroorotase
VDEVTLPPLFDAHVHLRDGRMLEIVAPYTDRCCSRCVIMPNTQPPLDTPLRLVSYRQAVAHSLTRTQPLYTFKISLEQTQHLNWLSQFQSLGAIAGKLYPEGVTTNSAHTGISRDVLLSLDRQTNPLRPLLAEMERLGLVLCLHGELPGEFCLDRESAFLEVVDELLALFPSLRIVLEHITTVDAVRYVTSHAAKDDRLACTLTLHHLLLTLDHVVGDALDPHSFCKPVAKAPEDREALVRLALADFSQVFLGSDSAPHLCSSKEHQGCAGIFSAPVLVERLVQFFEEYDALALLPDFAVRRAEHFYRLPSLDLPPLVLVRRPFLVPETIQGIRPFGAGETLPWTLHQE